MAWIEKEAKTVEEALGAAVAELGLPMEDAEVEVLREGAKGLFGLGGESALVRVRARGEGVDVRMAFHDRPPASDAPQPAAPSPVTVAPATVPDGAVAVRDSADTAGATTSDGEMRTGPSLAERQQIASDVAVEMVNGVLERMGLKGEVTTRTAAGTVYVEVFGDEMGILIGRGGKTLEALQELVRAGVQRKLKARAAVVVDVEAYWERRRETQRPGPRRSQPRSGNR